MTELDTAFELLTEYMKSGETKNDESPVIENGKKRVQELIEAMDGDDKYFEPIALVNSRQLYTVDTDKKKGFVYTQKLVDKSFKLAKIIENYDAIKSNSELMRNEQIAKLVSEIDKLEKDGIKKQELIPINIIKGLLFTRDAYPPNSGRHTTMKIKIEFKDDRVKNFWKLLLPRANL